MMRNNYYLNVFCFYRTDLRPATVNFEKNFFFQNVTDHLSSRPEQISLREQINTAKNLLTNDYLILFPS